MARQPKSKQSNASGTQQKSVRVVLFVSPVMYKNLELFCLKTGQRKQVVVLKLLAQYLESQGFDPSRLPKVQFSYEDE